MQPKPVVGLDNDKNIELFVDTLLTQVFSDSKLKAKRHRQILELLSEFGPVVSHIKHMQQNNQLIADLEYELVSNMNSNEQVT